MNIIKLLAISALTILSLNLPAEEIVKQPEIVVYRSPSCSCCGKWIEYLKQNNFNIKSVSSPDMEAVKEKFGVPDKLASCHTAVIDGYIVEGHVPVEDIKKMLVNKPAIAGIAAPGMPIGSPGMETDGQKDAYRVISFEKNGKTAVFAEHPGDK